MFMLHLPNIEIADLCLINLTSVSKNRAVLVSKDRSPWTWRARSRTWRAGSGRTSKEAGMPQDQDQLGVKQSLKMERKMPHVCRSVEPHSSPGAFTQFSELPSTYYALGPGRVLWLFQVAKRHEDPRHHPLLPSKQCAFFSPQNTSSVFWKLPIKQNNHIEP